MIGPSIYDAMVDELFAEWREFLEKLPSHWRDVANRYHPWAEHRVIATGERCRVAGFESTSDGDITLLIKLVTPMGPSWETFAVRPDELVPWKGEQA